MSSNPKIDKYGTKRWLNSLGQFHREDGPAIEHDNGIKFWYKNGLHHREDGPAVQYAYSGHIEWWIVGRRLNKSIIISKWR